MSDSHYTREQMIALRKKHFLPTAYLYYQNPLHLVKAQGVYVFDDEDRKYLDAIGGILCISSGHHHPKIKQTLLQMLNDDEIQHTSLLYLNRHVVALTEKLVEQAPAELDKCAMTNSGSEANELAFMAARQVTGETIIVNLRHGYHGGTSAALANCGHHTWRFRAQPVTSVVSALEPYCYRCPFKQQPESCGLECAQNVETTIQTATHGKIAGLIAEPIMGVGGFITPPAEYFHQVTTIVHRYGGKYISDEVQTGVGRGGQEFLMTKALGIDADMITLAKGLGNGAAVGAVLMKTEMAASLAGKLYFNTFAGDPYTSAQAKVNIEVIHEEKLINNAQQMGQLLLEGLKELMKTHLLIGDVRGRGLMVGVELVKDRQNKTYAPEETVQLMELCKDRGLLLGKGGLFGNVIRIAPPLSINKAEINFIVQTIDESLRAMKS